MMRFVFWLMSLCRVPLWPLAPIDADVIRLPNGAVLHTADQIAAMAIHCALCGGEIHIGSSIGLVPASKVSTPQAGAHRSGDAYIICSNLLCADVFSFAGIWVLDREKSAGRIHAMQNPMDTPLAMQNILVMVNV